MAGRPASRARRRISRNSLPANRLTRGWGAGVPGAIGAFSGSKPSGIWSDLRSIDEIFAHHRVRARPVTALAGRFRETVLVGSPGHHVLTSAMCSGLLHRPHRRSSTLRRVASRPGDDTMPVAPMSAVTDGTRLAVRSAGDAAASGRALQ